LKKDHGGTKKFRTFLKGGWGQPVSIPCIQEVRSEFRPFVNSFSAWQRTSNNVEGMTSRKTLSFEGFFFVVQMKEVLRVKGKGLGEHGGSESL